MEKFHFEVTEKAARSIRTRTLKPEEVLFAKGAPAECLYRVVKGSIRLVTYPVSGKPLVLYRAEAGEIFSEDHLATPSYRYSAIANENSVVDSISRELLLRELQNDPKHIYQYSEYLNCRIHQLQANFERIAIPVAKTRVLDFLRSLARAQSCNGAHRINLRGKVKSYSDDLNLSHEAMYRAIRKLESEGSIVRLADGCYQVV